MKIIIGSDHAGYGLKEEIKRWLKVKKNDVCDVGCFSDKFPSNYAIIAHLASRKIKDGNQAILVCGSGTGMNIVANKYKNIRAVSSDNPEIVEMARKHNNVNVICFGARYIKNKKWKKVLEIFLKTRFEGGRHVRRLEKIDAINIPQLSVSILDADKKKIVSMEKEIGNRIDFWHVDVMDGIFVENKREYNNNFLKALKKPLDIHFMVEDIFKYISKYKQAINKAKFVSFHVESKIFNNQLEKAILAMDKIRKEKNIQFGLAINPKTFINKKIANLINYFDFILIMTVVPGRGGQNFMKEIFAKKAFKLSRLFPEKFLAVDGGVKAENISEIRKYTSVNMAVVGSYITKADNQTLALDKLNTN